MFSHLDPYTKITSKSLDAETLGYGGGRCAVQLQEYFALELIDAIELVFAVDFTQQFFDLALNTRHARSPDQMLAQSLFWPCSDK
jgi:hypothetical protein